MHVTPRTPLFHLAFMFWGLDCFRMLQLRCCAKCFVRFMAIEKSFFQHLSVPSPSLCPVVYALKHFLSSRAEGPWLFCDRLPHESSSTTSIPPEPDVPSPTIPPHRAERDLSLPKQMTLGLRKRQATTCDLTLATRCSQKGVVLPHIL